MSNLDRKFKRKKNKSSKKAAKKILKQTCEFVDKMGDECLVCGTGFDRKDNKHLDSFRIVLSDKGIKLYCQNCWKDAPENGYVKG
jgi:hypothetical protein